jgi:hypothetical protein
MMEKYANDFEKLFMPIFEFMVEPNKIVFEDSILVIIQNFIKRTQGVSDIIFKVLPCLEKVFVKNKLCFGDTLIETLNQYLVFGREKFLQEQSAVEMIVKISDQAMFTLEPTITVNNAEGAILMQVIFQIFQGTEVLNPYFENILCRVLDRLKGPTQSPPKQTLKKHLLQVFLSALIYNASATLKLLEMKGVTKDIMTSILQLKKAFKNAYEQKCFIIGLTSIITVQDAPPVVKDPATISRLI